MPRSMAEDCARNSAVIQGAMLQGWPVHQTKNKIVMIKRIRRNAIRSELKHPTAIRRFAVCLAAALAIVIPSAPARAAFHLWNIREIYTDSSGTYQFIEFFTSSGSQQFVGGQYITVT